MTKIIEIGNQLGFNYILDGKNSDDLNVYRPGNTAIEELQIISPLSENNFNKEMIRKYSRKFGIKIWNTPSNSCLATRFPYNTILTEENLKKVEISEELLKKLEIPKVRVRVHESIAKIEVEKKYFETILKNEQTIKQIKELGFNFVVLDLLGLKNGAFD